MLKFETGKEYICRSVCDYDCTWTFKVLKRTAKSIWIKDSHTGEEVRKAVKVYDDCEQINPLGSYSMAPILTAEKIAA